MFVGKLRFRLRRSFTGDLGGRYQVNPRLLFFYSQAEPVCQIYSGSPSSSLIRGEDQMAAGATGEQISQTGPTRRHSGFTLHRATARNLWDVRIVKGKDNKTVILSLPRPNLNSSRLLEECTSDSWTRRGSDPS